MTSDRAALEERITAALAAGQPARAATLILEGYGDEIRGYVHARLRDPVYTEEAFASFAEDLWRALPSLEVRTTVRAFAYALARNAANRYLDRDVRAARRHLPLEEHPDLVDLVHRARTGTQTFLRTPARDALSRLRATLTEEEQTLLVLRVDRAMAWRELVEVLGETEDPERAVARMRKRFELLKKKLRRLAHDEGLLP